MTPAEDRLAALETKFAALERLIQRRQYRIVQQDQAIGILRAQVRKILGEPEEFEQEDTAQ